MKTIQNITKSILIAASVVLTASCHKDDDSTPAPIVNNTNNSFITAKVDGGDFTSFIFGQSAASCSKGGSGSDSFVTILGGNLAGNSITVYLQGNLAVGTYSVGTGTNSFLNYSPGNEQAFSTADCAEASGTIVVTVSDATHIEGTFSFVGKDTDNCSATKTVTQGSFKGIYPN